MKTWEFYSLKDGRFLGQRLSSDDHGMVERNTPEGCGSVEGEYDRFSQRVDLKTGEVVDYQPPQPDADHVWTENIFGDRPRWVKDPAVAAKERTAEAAQKEIEALERAQLRSVRELLIDSDNQEAKARLIEIDAAISEQRVVIQNATDKLPASGTGSAAGLAHP